MESALKQGAVIVFGGAGSIGSAVLRDLLQYSYPLVASSRSAANIDSLSKVETVEYINADVLDLNQLEDLKSAVLDKYGEISAIVLSVGSILIKPVHRTSPEEWHETIAINLTSAFNVSKVFTPSILKSSGSFIFISSAAAQTGVKNHEAIAAAKAGLVGLTRSMAATYASKGMRVNCVAPGLVETHMSESLLKNDLARKASEQMHPLGRIGKPEDVSSAISWLLQPNNTWVTGQVITVDGGLSSIKGGD